MAAATTKNCRPTILRPPSPECVRLRSLPPRKRGMRPHARYPRPIPAVRPAYARYRPQPLGVCRHVAARQGCPLGAALVAPRQFRFAPGPWGAVGLAYLFGRNRCRRDPGGTMTDAAHAHEVQGARRGRDARRAARAQRSGVSIPFITRNLPLTEVLWEEAMQIIEHNADTLLEETGIEFRDDRRPELSSAPAPTSRARACASRAACRALICRRRPAIHPARAQSRTFRPDRRQRHRLRAGLRPALRPRPRQGPALRHDRGFPNFVKLAYMTPPCTIPAARCASRSTCRSTSATSTWSMPTCGFPTSRSWARLRIPSARATR